ncbi:hypothetical protein K490DRAFT_73636 [Saccharata proteae CBS 121410]|uniref:Oxidoreductase NAD-binding domain-containing protein 1 n=1 Tax=Saccharata proteae CBS 121410 TaxID=1314787 RepID=A0A9P4HTH3_9PEZI|nr:hypothetical protein K490DRAFT_73636 [Saccharata proteae CBS 121410]
MSSGPINPSHEERTASEPRDPSLHPVILSEIQSVNETIRLIKLRIKDQKRGIKFLPGQWLDVFIPGLTKAGGFTITSTPRQAFPYLELAIQKSANPPAKWIWRTESDILGTELLVRVGGSFTWPPTGIDAARISRVVLVAGGVGINPLMSMLSSMCDPNMRNAGPVPHDVHLLYSSKAPKQKTDQTLFLDRLVKLKTNNGDSSGAPHVNVEFFCTGGSGNLSSLPLNSHDRRMSDADVIAALGEESNRKSTVCYVCGPQAMTDYFVELVKKQAGMDPALVLCEKWW